MVKNESLNSSFKAVFNSTGSSQAKVCSSEEKSSPLAESPKHDMQSAWARGTQVRHREEIHRRGFVGGARKNLEIFPQNFFTQFERKHRHALKKLVSVSIGILKSGCAIFFKMQWLETSAIKCFTLPIIIRALPTPIFIGYCISGLCLFPLLPVYAIIKQLFP
ncbi:hypothetical protein B0H19DRAFT_1059602 [Mycena capillaripes]|nr:hypothetical protein B0H19DRAFT_1059602 [Mycena capillaripes]